MVCYRPGMAESNIVASMESYVIKEAQRTTLRDSKMKLTKHSTRNMGGYNDVSRYTWSTIQPEGSELPQYRQNSMNDASKYTVKGSADQQMLEYFHETPAECIGLNTNKKKLRDTQHEEIVLGMMNR